MKFKGSSRQKIEFLNRSEKTESFLKTIENKVIHSSGKNIILKISRLLKCSF